MYRDFEKGEIVTIKCRTRNGLETGELLAIITKVHPKDINCVIAYNIAIPVNSGIEFVSFFTEEKRYLHRMAVSQKLTNNQVLLISEMLVKDRFGKGDNQFEYGNIDISEGLFYYENDKKKYIK